MKRSFLNPTDITPVGDEDGPEAVEHLSLRISNLIWVIPLDGSLHVSSATPLPDASRTVELHLVDRVTLTVRLNISEEQRMSDYLDANPGFMPLWSARIHGTEEIIERFLVNHEAILAIREVPAAE